MSGAPPDPHRDRPRPHLELVRRLCLALPGATERLSHGSPSFFAGGCFLMYVGQHHGDPHDALWCAAPPGAQEELTAEEPDRFFRPPYVGHRGWLGVRLPEALGPDDEQELGEVVTDAWRAVAPARLRRTPPAL